MNPSLNIVIFSKDRACQLDLLLKSMTMMFKECKQCNIDILYVTSSDNHKLAYGQLIRTHRNINFFCEGDFKRDLIAHIRPDKDYTVFFVYDIVWKELSTLECNAFDMLDKDPEILCLSLRLSPNLTYCYACDLEMKAPVFDRELRWGWRGEAGDFGYPMSLDGHIFRKKQLLPLLSKSCYLNPNTLECAMAAHPPQESRMLCLKKAPIFNFPINKVQTHNSNRHANISAEQPNKLFLP